MSDNKRSIIHSASRFLSGTMLSRITGMLRDMAMAYAFGTQSGVAALLVAFRFAHLLRRLFGEGALQTAFIPGFEELRKDDPMRAGRFFCDLVKSLTVFLGGLIFGVMVFLWFLYTYIDISPGNAEIIWLTFLMMPSLLFICLFGINAALLQCEKSYFVSSAAPVAFNLVWIGGVFYAADTAPQTAMSWLALFIVIACLAQWVITLPKTLGVLKSYHVSSFWKCSTLFSKEVIHLAKPLMLGLVGVAASQINNALDAIFARWANSEGPAFLWYAIRLQQLPLALFGIALSGALLPPLVRALKCGDIGKYRQFLNFAISCTLFLMIPMTCVLFVMGDGCINLIYGHGDFTNASIVETTCSLWGYSFGLLPMALVLVLAPAFYAAGDYRTPSMASVGAMMMNVVLNAILVGLFGFGAASVAMATSISAWFNCLWLAVALSKRETVMMSRRLFVDCLFTLAIAGIASAAVVWGDLLAWGRSSSLEMLRGTIPEYSHHVSSQLMHLGLSGGIFGTVLACGAIIYLVFLRTPKEIMT